jgi:hypothetical protein
MPQVTTSPVRVSRRTLHTVWWAYLGGALLSALVIVLVARPPTEGAAGPLVIGLVTGVTALSGVFSLYVSGSLPQAGHPIFDAVGSRFHGAMRNLFVRFVLAGAAAELTGLLGGLLHVLGASPLITATSAGGGIALLLQLRRRAAPLVHYLA